MPWILSASMFSPEIEMGKLQSTSRIKHVLKTINFFDTFFSFSTKIDELQL